MILRPFLFLWILLLFLGSCTQPKSLTPISVYQLHEWNKGLEEAIVNDFFAPPVAGRIYAYANLAANEVLAKQQLVPSLIPAMSQKWDIPQKELTEAAAIFAFYYTSIELVYSIEQLNSKANAFRKHLLEKGYSSETLQQAEIDGKNIAQRILEYAKTDGYNAMRSYDQYIPLSAEGSWQPTPPDYRDALEPHWRQLRPFTLDSAAQFKPDAPTSYSLDTTSAFFQETLEVYEALNNNTPETEAIAKFWDCNPLVMKHQGHVTFAEKKLTPGGHWMNIGRIAMKKTKINFLEATQVYAVLSIAMHEGFISCWDEKYRSNYIRPVTVIQEYIDPNWKPILYTPNFPEYPSGHSVVSGSAATVLTHYFGDNFAFIDSTEVPYGMPPRSFGSFYEASDEAAVSRLYGGIHFMPAIENGKIQGRQVGKHVLKTLQLKKAQ